MKYQSQAQDGLYQGMVACAVTYTETSHLGIYCLVNVRKALLNLVLINVSLPINCSILMLHVAGKWK